MGTVSTDAGSATFAGVITVNSGGGTLTNSSTSGTVTVSGQIIGTGLLTKNGTSTIILTNTNNTWSGGTTINAGTLQIGDGGENGSLPGTGTITLTLLRVLSSTPPAISPFRTILPERVGC